MKRLFFSLAAAVVLLAASLPLAAQKFLPKTIQFKGAPEYSDQELLAAAGLKMGTVLEFAEMKGHSQKLLDTGLFENVGFKFDGVDLVYTLTMHTELYPVRLENLPLAPGKELDAALHDRFPLYHGKVPAEGGLAEEVRKAFEEILRSAPTLKTEKENVIEIGDIALVHARWTLSGTAPDASSFSSGSDASAVLHRQPDGRWLMKIDNPLGAEILG